jgi:hypothetical protein
MRRSFGYAGSNLVGIRAGTVFFPGVCDDAPQTALSKGVRVRRQPWIIGPTTGKLDSIEHLSPESRVPATQIV